MASVDVKNLNNDIVGKLDLADAVFAGAVNEGLMHQAVKQYLASRRSGTHSTKTRAEVQGSGKKPWRQKGTGRARVGEIRNPLWRKGGTVFGPRRFEIRSCIQVTATSIERHRHFYSREPQDQTICPNFGQAGFRSEGFARGR
jgi:hypothetical protein